MNDSLDREAIVEEEYRKFVSLISHDLKAPIRHINGFSKLLKETHGDELSIDALEFLNHIHSAGEKLERMYSAIQRLASVHSEAGTPQEVDVVQVVELCTHKLKLLFPDIEFSIQTGHFPTVWADTQQVETVFFELVKNAIMFRHPDRLLTVSLEASKVTNNASMREFSVRDNGIGIKAEHLDMVIKLFKQVNSKIMADSVGAGLAIVQKIIERHGGTIQLQSDPGHGTKVIFSLPSDRPNAT